MMQDDRNGTPGLAMLHHGGGSLCRPCPDSRLALQPVSRSQRGESEADRSLASADCRRIYKGSVNSGDNLQAARVCTLGCAGKTPRRAKHSQGFHSSCKKKKHTNIKR